MKASCPLNLSAVLYATGAICLSCQPALAILSTPTVGGYDTNNVASANATPAYPIAQFKVDVATAFNDNKGGVINFENVQVVEILGETNQTRMSVNYGSGINRFGTGTNQIAIRADPKIMTSGSLQAVNRATVTPPVNVTPSGAFVLDSTATNGQYALIFSSPLTAVGVTVLGDADMTGFDLNITATAIDSSGGTQVAAGIIVPRNATPQSNAFIAFKAGAKPIVELIIVETNGHRIELDDLGFVVGLHSFVRGAPSFQMVNGQQMFVSPIAMVDSEFPGILAKFPGSTIDVVMQQCHSGGFGPVLSNSLPGKHWSFCSAANYNEVAYNVAPTNIPGYLDNFTRSWREDVALYPAAGMMAHYQTTVSGHAASPNATPPITNILQEPYAPPGNSNNSQGIETGPPVDIVPVIKTSIVFGTNNVRVPRWYAELGGAAVRVIPSPGAGTPAGWDIFVPTNPLAPPRPPQLTPGQGPLPNGLYRAAQIAYIEHPQYASAGTNSNARSLALPMGSTNQLFVIMVQWDDDFSGDATKGDRLNVSNQTPRFAQNISRIYSTMQYNTMYGSNYNVSSWDLLVLYYDGTYFSSPGTNAMPGFDLSPGPNGATNEHLLPVHIDGATGVNANGNYMFNLAVTGQLFRSNGIYGTTNLPGPNDHLLLYTTGHGGSASGNVTRNYINNNYTFAGVMVGAINDFGDGDGDGFDPVAEFEDAIVSDLGTTNATALADILSNTNNDLCNLSDPVDLIQISTSASIPLGATLSINGYSAIGWDSLSPITYTNATVYDLDPIVPGLLANTVTYQVSVSNSLLYANMVYDTNTGTTSGSLDITVSNLNPQLFNPNFIQAVVVRGVEQETAYVPADPTAVGNLVGQNFGGGFLLTWPAWATNYVILTNADLTTTNWAKVNIPHTTNFEVTGTADPNLPMGTNWAFFSLNGNQLFFRLQTNQP